MTPESYEDKLRRHSFESRLDPLRDAVRQALAAWHQEDELEKNDLSEDFWRAMGNLELVLRSVMRGGEEEVPEVEVTDDRTQDRSLVHVEAPESPLPARRSGAKNVSDPKYQAAFVDEARHSMGQPSKADAEACLGKFVVIEFNDDKPAVRGILTQIIDHPASGLYSPYLMLDDDKKFSFALNSIQSIRRVDDELAHH